MKVMEQVSVLQVNALVCDRCGHRADMESGASQEFLQLHNTGGYGSVIGDGVTVDLDLCEPCVKEVLGPWLRITPATY